MNYYVNAFKNYTNFQGRARRQEYWMFVLCNMVVAFVLSTVAALIHFPLLSSIYGIAVICPSIAVAVRRLHDAGKKGIWFFISLIPLIGTIWLLVLLCMDSQPGENAYGPNPKGL